jgi:hypothetical protein
MDRWDQVATLLGFDRVADPRTHTAACVESQARKDSNSLQTHVDIETRGADG